MELLFYSVNFVAKFYITIVESPQMSFPRVLGGICTMGNLYNLFYIVGSSPKKRGHAPKIQGQAPEKHRGEPTMTHLSNPKSLYQKYFATVERKNYFS
jgi:hypothetical protein